MSDNKGDKLNLDLIKMVQKARMAHDDDAKPSRVPGVYWIEAKCPPEKCQQPTSRSGEWRIQTTVEHVDALWQTIKEATESGSLGYKSKVSTSPAHNQGQRDQRIICVRTYDADDTEDVQRIKQALLSLDMPEPFQYQRDAHQRKQADAD
jgi:hypothetical protein